MGAHAYGVREERQICGAPAWRVVCADRPTGPPEPLRELAWRRATGLTPLAREERPCACGMVFTPRRSAQKTCDLCELRSLQCPTAKP